MLLLDVGAELVERVELGRRRGRSRRRAAAAPSRTAPSASTVAVRCEPSASSQTTSLALAGTEVADRRPRSRRRAARRRARRRSRAGRRPPRRRCRRPRRRPRGRGGPRRATSSATMRWSAFELPRDDLLVGTSTSTLRHLERRPVGGLGLRLHRELGREAPAPRRRSSAARSRSRAARSGGRACGARRSRTSCRCATRPPRSRRAACRPARRAPAAAPCRAGSRGPSTRSARSCVACSTACCTSSRGNLDRQADAVSVELLDLCLHRRAIESERVERRARGTPRVAWRAWTLETAIRTPPHPQGLRRRARSPARRSRSCSSSPAGRRTTI